MPSLPKPVAVQPDKPREKSWTLKSTICVARHGDRTPKCASSLAFALAPAATARKLTRSLLARRQAQVQVQGQGRLDRAVPHAPPGSHDRDHPARSGAAAVHRRRRRAGGHSPRRRPRHLRAAAQDHRQEEGHDGHQGAAQACVRRRDVRAAVGHRQVGRRGALAPLLSIGRRRSSC